MLTTKLLFSGFCLILELFLKPGVFQSLLTGKPLFRVSLKKFSDKVFTLVWDIVELFLLETYFTLFDLIVNFFCFLPIEWLIPWYEKEKENTDWPDIRFCMIASLQYFRCNVVRCSCDIAQLFRSACFWKTKVDKLYSSFICDHYILWFNVSMNDTLCMAMVYRLK